MTRKEIGENIRRERERLQMDMQTFANEIGLHISELALLEIGELKINDHLLRTISSVINVDLQMAMRPIGSTKDRLPILKEEFDRLIELTKHDKESQKNTKLKLLRAYTLLYLTGCRISEIIDFTCKDIETIVRHKMISLSNNTKTKTPRALLFNDVGVAMLSKLSYVDCPASTETLFYANNSDQPMNEAVFTRQLNTHLSQMLNPLYTTHSFRAGYITRIIEETGNVETARDLVGHSSAKTTLEYLVTSPKQKRDALDKIFKAEEK